MSNKTLPTLEKRQMDFLKNKQSIFILENQKYSLLIDKIEQLHNGTMLVMMPEEDTDIDKIIKDGFLSGNMEVLLNIGSPSQCHSNACDYSDMYAEAQIVTGYGLSEDGLWRQHSWVIHNDQIIETTEKRILYFGRILSGQDLLDFKSWNF